MFNVGNLIGLVPMANIFVFLIVFAIFIYDYIKFLIEKNNIEIEY